MNKQEEKVISMVSFLMAFLLVLSLFIYQTFQIQKLQNSVNQYEDLTEYYDEYMDTIEYTRKLEIAYAISEERIKWLENTPTTNVLNIDVKIGRFIGVNAYGSGQTYIVVEIDGEEYETVALKNVIHIMNEEMIVIKIDDKHYSQPVSKS